MKKIITLILSVLLFGTTFAVVTPSEQETIDHVTNFLEENGSLIDQKVGDSPEVQMMAQALRESLIADLTIRHGEEFSYSDFKKMLLEYVQGLNELKESKPDTEIVEFEQPIEALLVLQNHIWNDLHQGQDLERPIHETTNMAITLEAMVPFVGQIDGMWSMIGDSKVDLSKQIMESLLAMDLQVSVYSPLDDVDDSLAAHGLLDIKMPGNDTMYLGMKDIEVDGTFANDEQTAFIVEQMQDILKNAYISIPLEGGHGTEMMYIDTLAARHTLNKYITEKPLIRFYHKEGNSYYGFFSHDVCDMLGAIGADEWTVGDCHKTINDVLDESDGKGPIVLTMNNGSYGLSLHDFDGYMPTYLSDVTLMSWNAQRIVKAFMPFDDLGNGITYQGDEREIAVNDDEVNINISIENKDSIMTIDGSILADGMLIRVDGSFDSSYNNQIGSLTIQVSQGGIDLGEFVLDIDTQVRNIGSFEVDIPSNTMTMDEFTKMMEERMMQFYMQ